MVCMTIKYPNDALAAHKTAFRGSDLQIGRAPTKAPRNSRRHHEISSRNTSKMGMAMIHQRRLCRPDIFI
jgi:hypothetical protein